ncbi:serine/threonine-protein kinase [Streptomyces sp. CB03238]|uniref:serine/threonine-protein kinase n=1 Tax=Streptomyces sp. CB03238 TaxID=1907777 RepID=UPI000A11F1DE|nr:serine/threonine-protein kinase [Streptomyces sp. CB03238]ORT60086.1 serine/threonine protein kinase [Streptomyces sp. CB03238]
MTEGPGGARMVAGRYRLLGPLGRGGMGVVWRARDEVLGREVAVKEVRAPAGLGSADEQRLYARLEREAWAAARISHRNVVTVYDVATEDGRPWIVMELVRGLTLADTLEAEGPMPPRRAAHIGAEVLAALSAAHEAGVLHRDVKPANVLLANDGRVVLTDFGIAMVAGTSNLTMTGELIGSPEFLAPERALGQTPGPASDLWSLGVLLYAAVEGVTPFRQDTPLSTLRAVVDEELPPPRWAGPLAPVIDGLLRKDPAERLTAEEAGQQLRVVGTGGNPRTGPVEAGGSAATVVAAAGGAALAAGDSPGPSRRAGALLAAGVAVLLLAVAGLTYAVLRDDDRGAQGVGAGATSPGVTATPSSSKDDVSTPPPRTSVAPPPQSVNVYARAVRGSYSGTCPPPESEAPAFRATITLGRTPASVGYRWVTESGESPGWRTAEFGSGGDTVRRVEHTELTYEHGGTHRGRVRLEIRSPVEARSNWVGFSVTCKEPEPTGGTPSGSPAPTPTPTGTTSSSAAPTALP